MEKIIIASNMGGVLEQIEDKIEGILHNPDDYEKIAERMNPR